MSDRPRAGGPVDPRFAQARDQARARRRRAGLRRGLAGLAGLAGGAALAGLLAVSGLITIRDLPPPPGPVPPDDTAAAPRDGTTPAPPETAPPEQAAAPPERAAPRFMDLPGSPLRIEAGRATQSSAPRRLPRPQGVPEGRGRGDILVIRDTLIPPGERLAVALPTSQEDFAIFQAQRGAAARARAAPAVAARAGAAAAQPRNVAEAHALIARARRDGRPVDISTLPMIPPERRHRLYDESVLRIAHGAPVAAVLTREGLPGAEAERVAQVARDRLGLDRLEAGHIVALRWQAAPPRPPRFVQAAFYESERYVGALARGAGDNQDTVEITTGADPWIAHDLTARLDAAGTRPAPDAGGGAQPRIMDGIYGAALRQGLPPRLVGQMIMLLSAAHKLDTEARPQDAITLVMSAAPGAGRGGDAPAGHTLDRILYIGVDSATAPIRCYVYRPEPEAAPTCYGPRDSRAAPRRNSGGTGAAQASIGGGGAAVEQLVNRIIQVESGGRADAKNPLSSATGLGQFIDSTWLRMMRVYRPDLTAQLSRGELLALREDPEMSREMVRHLAREGADFLRARGHTITAGRLYLAHFLGMEGAHTALTAAPETDLLSLYGASVIRANPFLEGRDAGYVVQWAERKMSGASGRIAVIREPAGLDAFRSAVNAMLEG
ncbi:hypothetical protein [Roseovarius ramblicola]|uniref:Transglycosylase SLT domain-containing protein n=1 Tax=Roseovarius ramblicola TaxID=2022336 RepID=A0ABV5I3N1_9RHOB